MSKQLPTIALSLIAGVVGAWLFTASLDGKDQQGLTKRETAMERVIRTGILRCSYIPYVPYFVVDPQTGAKSGLGYEFTNAIAEDMSVKVEWVEEVGWGTFQEGLNTGRYDAQCTPLWESGARARAALLTRPLFADKMFAYVREDDHRFDAGLSSLNQEGVKIADYDSDITQKTRALALPLAQDVAVPSLTGEGEYLLNVITRKADAVLVGESPVARYNSSSAEKLKMVGADPVRMFSNVMAVRHGEVDLKAALDATIHSLIKSGKAAEILKKYPAQAVEE